MTTSKKLINGYDRSKNCIFQEKLTLPSAGISKTAKAGKY